VKPIRQSLFACAVAGLFFLGGGAARADEDVPTFKKANKRETEEFVTKVGTAIIKAARSKPQKIGVTSYKYTTPKEGRSDLVLKMHYTGFASRKKYNVDITVKLDSGDDRKWEVLNIDYKDTNPAPLGPSQKGIQELIKKFNK
jgi:hypothetical protein